MSTNLAQLIAHGFAKLTGAQRQAGATQPLAATASNVVVLPSGDQLTKAHVGLPSADNTSDANKPVSTAQQTALDFKLNAANPSYTGTLTGGTGVVNLGSGQVYKAADGKVGIGTASPTQLLDVAGCVNFQGSSTFPTTGMLLRSGDNQLKIVGGSAGIAFCSQSGASTVAALDIAGNLGLGVTPSAWGPAKAIQAGIYAAFGQRTSGTSEAFMSWNATLTSGAAPGVGYVYRSTGDVAGLYDLTGAHRWYTAPSGTAGNPISFTQAMTLDASGNLTLSAGALGYGTGAGGTVTQVTSKATAVTLNKPSGTVTMHNASLAAGASVLFALNNTFFATTDTVVLTGQSWSIFYRIETANSDTGQIGIRVTNTESVSRSDPLAFSFAIVKGATA